MGLIVKQLEIAGDQAQLKAEVLFDSGAHRSIIRKNIAEKIATLTKLPHSLEFSLANGESKVSTNLVANIEIAINDRFIFDQFYVIDKVSREVIIGALTMQGWEIKLDPKNESLSVGVDYRAIELI